MISFHLTVLYDDVHAQWRCTFGFKSVRLAYADHNKGGVRTSNENSTPEYTAPGIVAQYDAQIYRHEEKRVKTWAA